MLNFSGDRALCAKNSCVIPSWKPFKAEAPMILSELGMGVGCWHFAKGKLVLRVCVGTFVRWKGRTGEVTS